MFNKLRLVDGVTSAYITHSLASVQMSAVGKRMDDKERQQLTYSLISRTQRPRFIRRNRFLALISCVLVDLCLRTNPCYDPETLPGGVCSPLSQSALRPAAVWIRSNTRPCRLSLVYVNIRYRLARNTSKSTKAGLPVGGADVDNRSLDSCHHGQWAKAIGCR